MAEQKIFKELELGVRELFRILVPGAYVLVLFRVVAPKSFISQLSATSTSSGLAATFFLGLFGYALRAHDRWMPYSQSFEFHRLRLNAAINAILKTERDENVDIYKVFLETKGADVSDRIHYFSSFYYMLIELSLFSGMAAFFITVANLWGMATSLNARSRVPIVLIVAAAVLQFVVLGFGEMAAVWRLRAPVQAQVPKQAHKPLFDDLLVRLWASELVLALAGLVWLIVECWQAGALGLSYALKDIDPVPIVLMTIGYLFWRLGDKHWAQIIGEQVVLVHAKSRALIETGQAFVRPT